jgi:hypothetical protein
VEPVTPAVETPPSPPPAAEWNFVARHWRGLLPLWVSYWVINFVVGVSSALIVASIIAVFRSDDGYEPTLTFIMFVAIWATVAAISVWQIVGLWRSANRHIALRATIGKRSFWARAAQFAAILMAINAAVLFVRDGVPQLAEATRIAFMGDPDIAPYTIRTMRNGTEAEITGGFKYGLTKEFSTILAASPQLKVVHLHSGGGRIGEAKKLHAVFKKSGLTTYVSLECASACALAFAGGKERFIAPRGKLGFHAPSFPGVKIANMTDAIADQSALFVAAGVSPAFVSRALNTPSSTLWKPTTEELVRANAITGIADNARFAVSGYGADNRKEAVDAFLVKAVPLLAATKEKYPARYAEILNGFYKSYVDGDSERQQYAKMRQALLSMLEELRLKADDSVLVDFVRLQLDSFKHLSARNPTSCYLYASGTKGQDFSEDLGADLLRRERELNARIVNTAAPRPDVSEADLKRIISMMFKSPGAPALTADERALLKSDAVIAAKHGAYCQATIKFYNGMLALSEPDTANAFRAIMKGAN